MSSEKIGDIIKCSVCGKRAKIEEVVGTKITFALLDKGAMPIRCRDCSLLFCASCGAENNGCPQCSSTSVEIYKAGGRIKNIGASK
jgi:hypothetical protein